MNFMAMIDNMPESVYLSLRQAVELGKWEDGTVLSEEQKDNAMQAVLAWQAKHLDSKEHFTIGADGQLIERPKSELRKQFSTPEQEILRVKNEDL
ncbi:DUF1315 family protein [Catenovulum sp. SM1970]|uniref:YeaC family protein n=1 Tax=Marinifaba aquimaris TaxID=2741323 RepID=UPI001571BEAD|nr:DUF1315 family protein [Marinifaba aquimaris]NTS78542.1 DUF1315 family protein [Marinifaba aquimaris]